MDLLGFDPDTPPAQRNRVAVVLALALLGISSSAVLVRGMEAEPLAIAAWRTLGASLILSWSYPSGLRTVSRRDGAAIAAAGLLLGLHFWTWFASVQLTTVLRSTLLVCLVPGWTALLEWLWFRRRPGARLLLGLGIALPGLGLLAGDGGRASLAGDALATFAGALWSAYLLVGRDVRQRVEVSTYMGLVCASASAVLFLIGLGSGAALTGFPPTTWGLVALAVLGPQLLGHQGFAYAVRWVPAATLSAVTLLEPVGAAALAAVVLGEVPGPAAALGSAIVLLGTWISTRP
jgi:drug/metabolite transporter (DMT)-like permease